MDAYLERDGPWERGRIPLTGGASDLAIARLRGHASHRPPRGHGDSRGRGDSRCAYACRADAALSAREHQSMGGGPKRKVVRARWSGLRWPFLLVVTCSSGARAGDVGEKRAARGCELEALPPCKLGSRYDK